MSDSNDLVKTEAIESKENLVDINDQNILDYDDEIENNNVNTHSKEVNSSKKNKEFNLKFFQI